MSDKRRMFSDTVLRSADFMFLSKEAQLLYIQLCMEADDSGVVNNAIIVVGMLSTTIGATEEHLEELVSSGFVIKLEERLHVIADWFVQNQIKSDRFRESRYKDKLEKAFDTDKTGRYVPKLDTDCIQNCSTVGDKTVPLLDTDCIQNPSTVGDKNLPQYSIAKLSKDKLSIAKVSEAKLSTYICACDVSADTTDNIPDATDPPKLDISQELTQKAEEVRLKLKDAGLGVPDQISWLMRDFKFALEGKRQLHLTDDEFFASLDNYAALLAACKKTPDAFWWGSSMPIPSLFKGQSPPILRFLPSAFDIKDFRKTAKPPGNAREPPRRGVDSEYSLKSIAEGT